MFQTCPKCQYLRKESDTGSPGTCPSCGLIFEKYVEAVNRRTAQEEASGRHGMKSGAGASGSNRLAGNAVKLVLLAMAAGAAFYFIQKTRGVHRNPNANPDSFLAVANATGTSQKREFMELFDSDTALGDLAVAGQYTVVEVYLDSCGYCRELEAGLEPLRNQRKDIGLVRVHHPGRIHLNMQANSQEELRQKAEKFNARMTSYKLCGSPHVEVYGPDRQPLGQDQCTSKDGTKLLWSWITQETGIRSRSALGSVTGL